MAHRQSSDELRTAAVEILRLARGTLDSDATWLGEAAKLSRAWLAEHELEAMGETDTE
jgi:hypothetical protein